MPKPKSQRFSPFHSPCFISFSTYKNYGKKSPNLFLFHLTFLFFLHVEIKFSSTLLWKHYPFFIKLSCALDWVTCPENSYIELYLPVWWHLEMEAMGRFIMFKWGLQARLLMMGLVLLLEETTEVAHPLPSLLHEHKLITCGKGETCL